MLKNIATGCLALGIICCSCELQNTFILLVGFVALSVTIFNIIKE